MNGDLADIRDANDNELLELDTVTAAVNFISISNAATGGDPGLTVLGDDSNADLNLTALGTGVVQLGGYARGTIVSGSVTINAQRGVIITTALSAASTSVNNFDLINNRIGTASVVHYQVGQWTGSAGRPVVGYGTSVIGRSTFSIINIPTDNTGSAQLNGTTEVRFVVL